MKQSFLDSAEQGHNGIWRYISGILIAMVLGLMGLQWVGMPLASAIGDSMIFFNQPIDNVEIEGSLKQFSPYSLEASYISIHFAYAFVCIGIFIATKLLHQRKILTLISPDATFQWKRFGVGFSLWFILASLQTFVEFLYNPSAFTWNFQPSAWFAFLPWAIVLTPIQTSTEELLFRGYLLQGLGLVVRQPVVLSLISSLPFAVAHFSNPEMARGAAWIGLTYLVMGVFLTLITLQANRLELAMGVHAANNLFVVLIVNTQDSALPTPALIIQQIPSEPRFTLVALVTAVVIFYGLVFRSSRPQ